MTIIEIGFSRNFVRNWNQFDKFYGNSKSCKNGIREETIKSRENYSHGLRNRNKEKREKRDMMKKRKGDREQRNDENSECVKIKIKI